ncbi:hypothetical protein H0H92_013322 [Tricholoma furcatifolium]|nr:hypothetical protein H0H92_013322 [Tricholoma furcatifolium]
MTGIIDPLPALFQPTKIGNASLSHRVVLAPLTRFRNTKLTHVPILSLMKEHYIQRARVPGTLLIAEATLLDPRGGGYFNAPGLWSDEQIAAWKEITDAVHACGSSIFVQLWTLGRIADPAVLASYEPSDPYPVVGASDSPLSTQTSPIPRPLSVDEIQQYVGWYARAASNAVHRAGFDGVEIHGANGYLVDQFLQASSNTRTDAYGGSVERRSKFALEVVDAVVGAVGAERTALRLSPWSLFQGNIHSCFCRVVSDELAYRIDMGLSNARDQFSHLVTSLVSTHPALAYLHVIEPRVINSVDREPDAHESNDFLRDIWGDRPYISAGGHNRNTALLSAERKGRGGTELVAFGRLYTSNPDLPLRLKHGLPLEPYNRETFYVPGEREDADVGYLDYTYAEGMEVELSEIPKDVIVVLHIASSAT